MSEEFLIQDTRHAGDVALWWGPKRCGYTFDIAKAGRYSREDAFAQERRRDTDRAVPLSIAMSVLVPHVRLDALAYALSQWDGK